MWNLHTTGRNGVLLTVAVSSDATHSFSLHNQSCFPLPRSKLPSILFQWLLLPNCWQTARGFLSAFQLYLCVLTSHPCVSSPFGGWVTVQNLSYQQGLFIYFPHKVLLYCQGWPWACDAPASASQVPKLEMCTKMPFFPFKLFFRSDKSYLSY